MKIKKGDKVQLLSGKDRGKSGKVSQVDAASGRLTVEGLNIRIKHRKARKQGEKGQRIEFAAPLLAARVMLICPKCGKPTRVGYTVSESGEKSRNCRKCKQTF